MATKRGQYPLGYKLKILGKQGPPSPFGVTLTGNKEDFFAVVYWNPYLRAMHLKEIQDRYLEECGAVDPCTMLPFKASEQAMALLLNGFKEELNGMNYITDPLIHKERKKRRREEYMTCNSGRRDKLERAAVIRRRENTCKQSH